MDKYLDQLTYEQLDNLWFAEWNINPASPMLDDISAAITRKQYPIYEGVVVEDAPVYVLQLAEVAG